MKECTTCKKFLAEDFFYRRSDNGKLRSECKPCASIRSKLKWSSDEDFRARGKARAIAHMRLKLYGISEERFLKMLEEQNNSCAICGVYINHSCHVDHCHSSGKVRGLLCNLCNKGLGHFKDNIKNMEAAIDYLKNRGI